MARRLKRYQNLIVMIGIVLCVLLFVSTEAVASDQKLRVGVYDNPPKILLNQQGQISGILGDLLSAIAKQENWQIEPVQCTWKQCLQWLQQGEIDLMPDVAFSDKRAALYQFHTIPALRSWSQIYTTKGLGIGSLLDLDGKRIAILNGSIQQKYLAELTDNFGLHIQWLPVSSMEQGFKAVLDHRADAIAANNLAGDLKAEKYDLIQAPVLFQPTKLYYAAPLHEHKVILSKIDYYLAQWKADPDSVYYQILQHWNEPAYDKRLPATVWWAGGLLILVLTVILIFNRMLRRQVAEKTQSLRESQARLNTILDSVDAHIYIKSPGLRYQYANRKLTDTVGLKPDEIIGKTDRDLFDTESSKQLEINDTQVILFSKRVAIEESIHIGGEFKTFYSVKLPLCHPDGSVYALCGISTDLTEHRRIQQQLHKLAFYDPLTGLANRRLLIDSLHKTISRYEQTNQEGAVFLIDIDGFKTLNESMGHSAGDTVLRQLSRRLQQEMEPDSIIARLGSDEFVLVLTDLADSPEKAVMKVSQISGNLIRQLEKPYQLTDINYVLTCSIGIAMFSDAAGSVESVLQYVDLALHKAKETGRSTVRFFNPEMQSEVKRRNYLETALREAISYQRLEMHVQPQTTSGGQVTGMEALVRWHERQLGPISPAEFIPLAEASGLIISLGEWVLIKACETLSVWSQIPQMRSLVLAVNISPKQFRHPGFIEQVEKIVTKYAIDPRLLELEVTESLLIDDLVNTIERMKYLSRMGIRFSLDDFGTGYASLSYLKSLPLHKLKIDQSFVRDLMTDPNDEAIISTIISLGNSLEMQVIAEGVETQEQAEQLQQMGCDFFQGYYYGKPDQVLYWQQKICENDFSLS